MQKQSFLNFMLGGVSLSEFGLYIPSPVASLELSNSEVASMTSWTLKCVVGGDDKKKINISAFESLLYTSAQDASSYENSSGIPVSFVLGWLDEYGNVAEHLSYQGFTLQFKVSTSGLYMIYEVSGFATLALQTSMPVLNIPEVRGIVQPSAIVEGLAKSLKATNYYELDIDHNDVPTFVNHNTLNTSFNNYVRGSFSVQDDYDTFPGLLRLSKSYNSSRSSGGLNYKAHKLSQVMNNIKVSNVSDYLKLSITDASLQCNSFCYWIDEPTMTSPGCIHYKSMAGLTSSQLSDTLEYGTANSNVLSINGSYNGVAYNMTDMNFKDVGFITDGSGNTIANDAQVVNSWSSTLAGVFQTSNIINDINAMASQFSGEFTVQLPGSTSKYRVAQPVSLIVVSGNTLSPITGIYNITSVSHSISTTFITTLKLQRLVISSANQVASSQNILVSNSSNYNNKYTRTSNIINTHKVDFGILYPTFSDIRLIGGN